LVFKDLHWRFILAPNFTARRATGWHIFKHSAAFQLISLLTFACAASVFSLAFLNRSWQDVGSAFWQHRMIPFELLAAVACAVLVSSKTAVSAWHYVITFALMLLLGALISIPFGGLEKWPTWPISDFAYAAALLTFSFVLITFSNRLWTAKRLVSALKPARV
jgi:hypothetical protein